MKRVFSLLLVLALVLSSAPAVLPAEAADLPGVVMFAAPTDGAYSLFLGGSGTATATLSGFALELLTVETSDRVRLTGPGWELSSTVADKSVPWVVAAITLPCAADSVIVTVNGTYTSVLSFAAERPSGSVAYIAYPAPTGSAADCSITSDTADVSVPLSGITGRAKLLCDLFVQFIAPQAVTVPVEVLGSDRYQKNWEAGRKTAGSSSWAPDNLRSAILLGLVPNDLASDWKKPISRLEFCRTVVKSLETLTGKTMDKLMSERGVQRNPAAFSDTSHPDVLACFALGVVSGNGDGTFAPGGTLTRAHAAGFLRNMALMLGENVAAPSHGFTDKNFAAWMTPHINYVKSKSIMIGNGDGTFGPTATFTREQAVTTMLNFTMYYFWRAYGEQALLTRARMFKNQDYLSFTQAEYLRALELAGEMLRLVNLERAKEGLAPLELDLGLTVISMLKCHDMDERGYFAHESPTYGQSWDALRTMGISYRSAGENLLSGTTSASEALSLWMDSPGHRSNILDTGYTKIGIGVSWTSGKMGVLWAQTFMS